MKKQKQSTTKLLCCNQRDGDEFSAKVPIQYSL